MSGIVTKPYDEDLAVELCERIAQGEAFNSICDDPRFPSTFTVRKWMADNAMFSVAYARAREAQMEIFSQEIVAIADDAAKLKTERIGKNGEVTDVVTDPGAVQAAKLRIDTRWRLMSTLARSIYGDKVDVKLSGSVDVSALSDAELEARTRARLVALGVEVAGPLLLSMPGTAPAAAATREPAPDPEEIGERPTRSCVLSPRIYHNSTRASACPTISMT
jgi:hypothetical protein